MNKKIIMVMMGLMLTGSSCNVFATEIMPAVQIEQTLNETGVEISPYFKNIISASGSAKLVDGKIQLYVTVNNRKSSDVKIKMQLQKKSGGTWSTIKTWNKSYSNKSMVSANESYAGSKGCTYRMKYTITVGEDNKTSTTPEVKV